MGKFQKIKTQKSNLEASHNSSNKKTFFKRKKHDLNFGSASEGQGFTLSRKLKAVKKYKNKNKANDSTDGKDNEQKFGKTKFNKLEHARQKYQEQKTAALIMRQEREKEKELHEKTVGMNIKKRKKTRKDLSKKTRKGQVIMANQMNYLLEKIQKKT